MKVSIILPVYNTEPSQLTTAIDSCLAQTYKDWELIIIDDQSDNEDTLKALEPFKQIVNNMPLQSMNIVWLNTKDIDQKGLVAALNYGINKATGDFIARMDSDDIMEPERLEQQVNLFKIYPDLNLCATNASIINEEGVALPHSLMSTDNLANLNEQCCIIHPTVMWRKSYFYEHNLVYRQEYEYVEDYDLWLRYVKTPTPSYARLPGKLIKYRVGPNRISAQKHEEQNTKNKALIKEHDLTPLVSVIYIGDKGLKKESLQSLENGNFLNYEIVKEVKDARGKYIAFSKFINNQDRLQQQYRFLENDKRLIGCGSYIQQNNGSYFYPVEPHIVESELFKGHMPIEPGTFMFYNNFEIDVLDDFFKLFCSIANWGRLTNIPKTLVKTDKYDYKEPKGLTARKQAAKEDLKLINVVQLNITSEGNFSGVDRYLKTLKTHLPPHIRTTTITFVAGTKFELKKSYDDSIIYYNPKSTVLEHIYDLFWDNFGDLFSNKPNLIVQANCLNLYSLITYIRQKVNCKHICAMHCVPFRETARFDKKKYEELTLKYEDDSLDFIEEPRHILPFTLADHVILNNKDSEAYYHRVGHHTPYSVISNGVEKLGRKESPYDKFIFTFVGHGSPLKGMDQLIPIVEEVYKVNKNFEVWWAGSTSDYLVNLIKEKQIPIRPLGVIPPSTLNEMYQIAGASLIASACETCSYAAIEALSAELPIIATNAPGVREIVEGVGTLIDIKTDGTINAEQYKDAMLKIMDDANLRKEMSEKSATRYQDYTIDKLIGKTKDLYEKLAWN